MADQAFDTELQEQNGVLNGPFRFPVQMLAEQEAICRSMMTIKRKNWALAVRR